MSQREHQPRSENVTGKATDAVERNPCANEAPD